MESQQLLESLADPKVLLEAYAASSAYVMRKALATSQALKGFEGRSDLAPAILGKIEDLTRQPSDPVVLSSHLYALEQTGATQEINTALLRVLEKEDLRLNPLIGQLAGTIGVQRLMPERGLTSGGVLATDDLERVVNALKKAGGL